MAALPKGWIRTLPIEQQEWLGHAMFKWTGKKYELTEEKRMWWFPPGPRPDYTQPPTSANVFFQRPFFLWMPRRYDVYLCTVLCCATCNVLCNEVFIFNMTCT